MQLENLKTNYLGKEFIYYKEIDSTQDEIWRRIKNNNIKNGTIIMADIQTKGKGTHGRIWHTDETENIAFSLYIKTDCNIKNVEGITIAIAEILVRIFKQKYNIQLDIKKPNDIMFNNKKLGGILTESKVNADKVKLLVIGIGINTEKANFTNFCIDKAQTGLACVNSWGAIPLEKYRLPYQDYEFSFIMSPVSHKLK